jgi:hypothetical protein
MLKSYGSFTHVILLECITILDTPTPRSRRPFSVKAFLTQEVESKTFSAII